MTWRIESRDGRVVSGPFVARDVRRLVPKNNRFWETFARGTHQNWPVFDGRKKRGMTGRYVFRLTTEGSGRQTLRSGKYVVVVMASDSAGNRGVARRSLSVPADLSGS